MSKYEAINKEKVIRLCNRLEELEDMQYHYDINSGEIIHAPDKELVNEEHKLLAEAYEMLRGKEKDIKNDYEELPPYSLLVKEELFIRSAKKLLDIYHEEFPDRDLTELKKFFTPAFNNKWYECSLAPCLRKHYWSKKDLARIAYLIFKSEKRNVHNVATVFSAWHKSFCEIIGGEYTAEYKPNKLKHDMGDIREIFFFLL